MNEKSGIVTRDPSSEQEQSLIAAAQKARRNAVAPFSRFKVGAALRAKSGAIYTGCNVENASYGLSVCAERVALLKALSEGERKFAAIAVVTAAARPTPPCGACRQLLWEYCGDIPVVLKNTRGARKQFGLATLFPHAFDRKNL